MPLTYNGVMLGKVRVAQEYNGEIVKYDVDIRQGNCLAVLVYVRKATKEELEKNPRGKYYHQLYSFFADEQHMKNIMKNEGDVFYGEDGLKALGFDFDNIWDLMAVFFCGWGRRLQPSAEPGWLYSVFDASYGWESVMISAFDAIAPYLEDGSKVIISPDSDYDEAKVENGKAVWVH